MKNNLILIFIFLNTITYSQDWCGWSFEYNFELKNKHKEIELELTQKENMLVFTANNTGYLANNTARVDLFDDKIKHQIITELQLNKSVNVIIKKQ